MGRGHGRFSGNLRNGWERGYRGGARRRLVIGARVALYSTCLLQGVQDNDKGEIRRKKLVLSQSFFLLVIIAYQAERHLELKESGLPKTTLLHHESILCYARYEYLGEELTCCKLAAYPLII